MNRETRRMCLVWVCEYLVLKQRRHVQVKANDIVEALGLQPGSAILISSFLKGACYSRNNLGFFVRANNKAECKLYSVTLRETFDKISQKVLDD